MCRCMAAWQARVHRKQLLQDLLQQGLVLSEQLAAKAAFRVWFEVCKQLRSACWQSGFLWAAAFLIVVSGDLRQQWNPPKSLAST